MNPLALTAIFKVGEKLIDRIFPDPEQKAKAQLELWKMQQAGEFKEQEGLLAGDAAQAQTNTAEAQSDSLFRGGWRPAVGWTCALGLFYQLLLRPIIGWLGENLWMWKLPPSLEMETLLTLLFGMLGLGYYRTRERLAGKVK